MVSPDIRALGDVLLDVGNEIARRAPSKSGGMSLASVRVMARLSHAGPIAITMLAALEDSSQPTMTNRVKRLERAGWVRRGIDPTDARVSIISLSRSGQAELARMKDRSATDVAGHLEQLSPVERDDLARGLAVLRGLLHPTPPGSVGQHCWTLPMPETVQ